MKELTNYPADLARMSAVEWNALTTRDLVEADHNIEEAIDFLMHLRTKAHTAKVQRFGEQARAALRASGRDFGTVHLHDGALHVEFNLPKKVTWNQALLKGIVERIVASGDKVEDYVDIKLSVSETRYTSWPTALQEQFAAARTADEGKPTINLTLDGGAA